MTTDVIDIAAVQAQVERFLPRKIFDMFYGEPASGKSEAIKALMKQALKENPGKKIKLIIGDGSAGTYEGLIESGDAELCEFIHRPWPLDTLNKLTSGWWLKDVNDPTSALIPPAKDEKGPNQLSNYCFTVIEGFSVGGKYLMGSVQGGMAYRVANGEQIGPDPVMAIKEGVFNAKGELTEGPGTAFGTNGTAHYMAAQNHLVEFAQRSRALPGHVIWTAHETIMDDVTNIGDLRNPVKVKKGVVIGGPEAAGKALTPNLQRIFNNTFHFQTIAKDVAGDKDEATGVAMKDLDIYYRIWTRDHHPQTGATSVKYKACTRNVSGEFPAYFDGARGENIIALFKALKDERIKDA